MREWAFTLILTSLLGIGIRELIPRGESSPLYAPLRFLLSLITVLAVISPVLSFCFSEEDFPFPEIFSGEETKEEAANALLEASGRQMAAELNRAFPGVFFSLSFYTDENGGLLRVKIQSDSAENGVLLADFLERTYGVPTEIEKKES